jgi:hypothetical protein
MVLDENLQTTDEENMENQLCGSMKLIDKSSTKYQGVGHQQTRQPL